MRELGAVHFLASLVLARSRSTAQTAGLRAVAVGAQEQGGSGARRPPAGGVVDVAKGRRNASSRPARSGTPPRGSKVNFFYRELLGCRRRRRLPAFLNGVGQCIRTREARRRELSSEREKRGQERA
jgi:hypothetical protein